jgi:hypothetical protein
MDIGYVFGYFCIVGEKEESLEDVKDASSSGEPESPGVRPRMLPTVMESVVEAVIGHKSEVSNC